MDTTDRDEAAQADPSTNLYGHLITTQHGDHGAGECTPECYTGPGVIVKKGETQLATGDVSWMVTATQTPDGRVSINIDVTCEDDGHSDLLARVISVTNEDIKNALMGR